MDIGAGIPSAVDTRAEVGVATRNLVIRGAHIVVNGSSSVELSNVHLLQGGQVGILCPSLLMGKRAVISVVIVQTNSPGP